MLMLPQPAGTEDTIQMLKLQVGMHKLYVRKKLAWQRQCLTSFINVTTATSIIVVQHCRQACIFNCSGIDASHGRKQNFAAYSLIDSKDQHSEHA